MSRLFNRIITKGSIAAASLAIAAGAYSIAKNTPTLAEGTPQIRPPSQPAGDLNHVGDDQAPLAKKGYIGGSGLVEPSSELIAIGSNVSGVVTKVAVRSGDRVKAGETLFEIDSRSQAAELNQKRAEWLAAKARLIELRGQIAPAAARVQSAEALVRQAKTDLADQQSQLNRTRSLSVASAVSAEEFNRRSLAVELSVGKVAEAEAKLVEARGNLELLGGSQTAPTLAVQEATIESAKAAMDKAGTTLALQTVRAPRDATVLQVKVRTGEFAQAAALAEPLMILGVIDPLHVRVDIDEAEIPRFQSGASAFASLKGDPARKAPLKFVRVEPLVIPKKSLTGSVSERVDTRVMQIIFQLDPAKLQAITGQQLDVYIEEGSQGTNHERKPTN